MAWAIDLDHEVWIYKHGYITWELTPNEKHWNLVEDEGFVFVDVGKDGKVVAITTDGRALYRTGVSQANLAGSGWEDISLEGHQLVSCAVGDEGFIYVQSGTDG